MWLIARLLIACGPVSAPSPRPATGDPPGDAVVARWDGGQVTFGDLRDVAVRHEIDAAIARHARLTEAAEELAFKAVLAEEARRLGHPDAEALLAAEVAARGDDPDRAARIGAYAGYLSDLEARYHVQIAVPWPDMPRVDVPIAPHDPTRGPADARVTIVRFTGFECAHCAAADPVIDALLTGDVRLVHKDFFAEGGRARPAAIAARCAGDQGRFFEMSARLFQGRLQDDDLLDHADALGLDANDFERCLTSRRHDAAIDASIEEGRRLGLTATPTFFVNGITVPGAQPAAVFSGIVERERGNAPPATR